MQETTFIGLDIGKNKIDIALKIDGKIKTKVIENTQSGFQNLIFFIQKHTKLQIHICCEATGQYWEALAYWLAENYPEVKLSVVNPVQIAHYIKVIMMRTKTDVTDAKAIADYCQKMQPKAWQPEDPTIRKLKALSRQINALNGIRTQEKNRAQVADKTIQTAITAHIAFIDKQIQEAKAEIAELIENNEELKQKEKIIKSIPAIGNSSAPVLLALLADISKFPTKNQLTAFVGLSPKQKQSGSSVNGKTRISKIGSAEVRKALYMPAVVAYSRVKTYHTFVKRLQEKGKAPKVIIVALMRKLLLLAYTLLKKNELFNTKDYKGA